MMRVRRKRQIKEHFAYVYIGHIVDYPCKQHIIYHYAKGFKFTDESVR